MLHLLAFLMVSSRAPSEWRQLLRRSVSCFSGQRGFIAMGRTDGYGYPDYDEAQSIRMVTYPMGWVTQGRGSDIVKIAG